jgi:hypothetical protein
MQVQTTPTNRSATIFGWLVAQETRLHRTLQRLVLRPALRRAYVRFAAANPQLAASLFDDHFVQTRIAPLLALALDNGARLRPEAVAESWLAACGAPKSRKHEACFAAVRAATELLAYIEQELRPEQRQMLAIPAPVPERDDEAAALFAQAVQENSNLEMDWLWLASRVTGTYERGYCLRKALAINPSSELARSALHRAGS